MPYAWPQLDYLAALLLALGLCLGVVIVTKAFFGVTGSTLGKLPWLGGWIDATGHKIEQRITNLFGGWAMTLEARIGASFHSLARLVDHIGREIARHAGLIASVASLLPGVGMVVGLLRELNNLRLLAQRLAHEIVGIGHDLAGRIGHVERGIGADVLPRIRGLERELHRELAHERARARAAERKIDREITNLWKWTRTHPWTIVTDAFVGAVALALARLGLDWIRCPSAKRVASKRGCGMWDDLDALLGLAVTALTIADLKELVRTAQKVEHAAAETIEAVLRV